VKDKFYLLDVLRKRLDFPSLKREVVRLRDEFRPNKILVKDKASGTQLIQELKEAGIFETFAYAPPAGADKIMRLHAQTAPFEMALFSCRATLPGSQIM
jgi:predicted phage terminase large subunit-like protein